MKFIEGKWYKIAEIGQDDAFAHVPEVIGTIVRLDTIALDENDGFVGGWVTPEKPVHIDALNEDVHYFLFYKVRLEELVGDENKERTPATGENSD